MEVATFVAAYIQFVDALRAAYGAAPHIFAISSSMLSDGWPDATVPVAERSEGRAGHGREPTTPAAGDTKVHKLYVSKQGGGCGTHPNVAGQAATAGELATYVRDRHGLVATRPALALTNEGDVVDEEVVFGARRLRLEVDGVDPLAIDVRPARRAPERLLRQIPERQHEARPLLADVDGVAEVVEAVAADLAVGIGVAVRQLDASLPVAVGGAFGEEGDPLDTPTR